MRQSSNNHRVPTVLLGQGETPFFPNSPDSNTESWLSFESNTDESDFSQAVSQSPETLGGLPNGRSPTSQPTGEAVDLDADYWQSAPQSSYSEHNSSDVADDFLFEDDVADSYEETDWTASETESEFDADLFADDFVEQDNAVHDSPNERLRPRRPRRTPYPQENLDYLFGENKPVRAHSQYAGPRYKNGQGQFSNPSQKQPVQRQPIKRQLEVGFLKAVMAGGADDYFKAIRQVLTQATAALPSDGRSPSILQVQLSAIALLIKRYAACGLDEQAALADVIALHGQFNSAALVPVLSGLATRLLLRPHLDNGVLSPPVVQRLFGAIAESVKMLSVRRQLKALPGLIARLSQLPVQDRHAIAQLSQQLDSATLRTTQNPQLYQRLCQYADQQTAQKAAQPNQNAAPQRLRINGPVEIFFRPLDP